MNNISAYIINEFEQRRMKEVEKKDIEKQKCKSIIASFEDTIKNALKDSTDFNSFYVKFPPECSNDVQQYLSNESIETLPSPSYNPYYGHYNYARFQYNPNCKQICALLYYSNL